MANICQNIIPKTHRLKFAEYCVAVSQKTKCPAKRPGIKMVKMALLTGSGRGEVTSRASTCALVRHNFEGHLLAFLQRPQTGSLDSGDMNENVLLAVVGLNESIALLLIEPLHNARIHGSSLSLVVSSALPRISSRQSHGRELEESCVRGPRGERSGQSSGPVFDCAYMSQLETPCKTI
jgi:hypothetical protein